MRRRKRRIDETQSQEAERKSAHRRRGEKMVRGPEENKAVLMPESDKAMLGRCDRA